MTQTKRSPTLVLAAVLLLASIGIGANLTKAGHFTAGATDAVLDGGQPTNVTYDGTTYNATPTVLSPASGRLDYNTTYDLVFTNVSTNGGGPSGAASTTTSTGLFLRAPTSPARRSPATRALRRSMARVALTRRAT